MDKRIKTVFIIVNILFLVALFSSYTFGKTNFFEPGNIIDYRILLVFTIINFIVCCLLLLSVVLYNGMTAVRSKFQDRIILTFGINALLAIILQRNAVERDIYFIYYLASLILFGILSLIISFVARLKKG